MDESNVRARKLITTSIDIVKQSASADNLDGILQSLKEHEVRTQVAGDFDVYLPPVID
jgi:hypothetical protein